MYIDHIKVQAVCGVLPLELAARIEADVKKSIVQLAIVCDAAHDGLAMGLLEVQHANVFRMRVNDPRETVVSATIAFFVFVLCDQAA